MQRRPICKYKPQKQLTVYEFTIKTAEKVVGELNQTNESSDTKREDIQHAKARLREFLKNKRESKVMHGQYIRNIDKEVVNEDDLFLWLLRGDVKAETKRVIIAAKDQPLQTKCHATEILKTVTANADYINNMIWPLTTLYQCAQYWQKNST
jgi:hypothetical protein